MLKEKPTRLVTLGGSRYSKSLLRFAHPRTLAGLQQQQVANVFGVIVIASKILYRS